VNNGLTAIEYWPDVQQQADASQVPAVKAIASFLLTSKGDLRSKMDVRSGFPASGEHHGHDARHMKERMHDMLGELHSWPGFAETLRELAMMPDTQVPDDEWQFFSALRVILLYAVGQLRLVCAEQGELDFNEVT